MTEQQERVERFSQELREGPPVSDRSIKEIIDALRPQVQELVNKQVELARTEKFPAVPSGTPVTTAACAPPPLPSTPAAIVTAPASTAAVQREAARRLVGRRSRRIVTGCLSARPGSR